MKDHQRYQFSWWSNDVHLQGHYAGLQSIMTIPCSRVPFPCSLCSCSRSRSLWYPSLLTCDVVSYAIVSFLIPNRTNPQRTVSLYNIYINQESVHHVVGKVLVSLELGSKYIEQNYDLIPLEYLQSPDIPRY